MITRRRVLALGWLLLLALSAVLPITALLRGSLSIGWTELVVPSVGRAPLVTIGRSVDLMAGSRSVTVTIGADIQVHGHVTDDLLAFGGRIFLARGARIDGDVLTVLGGVYRQPGARTNGRVGGGLHTWNGRAVPAGHNLPGLVGNSMKLGLAAGLALLLAGTCLTIVFPWQVVLISSTLRGSPLKSLVAAVMILLTFVFLVVPLGLSLAGLPFALLLSAAASLAWLFGMTSFAVVLGRLLGNKPASLLWTSAAGLVTLALAMAVPLVGPIVVTTVGVVGAGALAVALVGRARPSVPLA